MKRRVFKMEFLLYYHPKMKKQLQNWYKKQI
jgi:hypothetical protein